MAGPKMLHSRPHRPACRIDGGGGIPVTTENITVLFTDIVGSTKLASSLYPDDADEVRRGHFSILRQAVAEANGIEVKNLGDGLMVAFTSPSSALSCAVAMQQRVEQHNALWRCPWAEGWRKWG